MPLMLVEAWPARLTLSDTSVNGPNGWGGKGPVARSFCQTPDQFLAAEVMPASRPWRAARSNNPATVNWNASPDTVSPVVRFGKQIEEGGPASCRSGL